MNPKTRITLVISSLRAGGAERVVSSLANLWARQGHQVTIVTLLPASEDHYPLADSIARVVVGFYWDTANPVQRVVGQYRRLRKLRSSIVGTQPDVVLSFVDKTNVRVLLSLVGTSLPVVVSERSNPELWPLGGAWHYLRRLCYKRAAAVVVQTDAVAAWAKGFVEARKVHVVPNPVGGELIAKTPLHQRQDIVLAMGRLSSEKGFDMLLQAWSGLDAACAGWKLQILGDGPDRKELQALAKQLGVSSQVEFVGMVRDPKPYLDASSVFVLSSRLEGFPNALLEAMAMGNAVISFDCDYGPRDIIGHGEGVLIPQNNIIALKDALQDVLTDADKRLQLQNNALVVRQRFAEERVLKLWYTALESAIQAAKS